jgi:hypothetical protein
MKNAAIPPLQLQRCPFGCKQDCEGEWVNPVTSHRLVCICAWHNDRVGKATPTTRSAEIGRSENQGILEKSVRLTAKVDSWQSSERCGAREGLTPHA